MKKIVLIIFLFSSLIIAQQAGADSSSTTAVGDSVNIREIVQAQIQKALDKKDQSYSISTAANVQNTSPAESTSAVEQPSVTEQILLLIWHQPLHLKIFEIGSILVIFFISFKRLSELYRNKSLHALKEKIALLRSEKVLSKQDPKLQLVRKQLSSKDAVFNQSEKQFSKMAKELKIAKGEMLLAARLKLFEVGKM